MRRIWLLLGASIVAAALLFGLAGTVLAHARLSSATPAAGARLTTAPATVTLVFSEEISGKPAESFFSVTDAAGTVVGSGKLDTNDLDRKTMTANLTGSLANGVYTVTWQVLTPDDGGVTAGTFTFGVNADPGPQKDVEGIEVEASAPTATPAAQAAPTATPAARTTPTSTPASGAAAQPTAAPAGGAPSTLPRTGGEASHLVLYAGAALVVISLGLLMRRRWR